MWKALLYLHSLISLTQVNFAKYRGFVLQIGKRCLLKSRRHRTRAHNRRVAFPKIFDLENAYWREPHIPNTSGRPNIRNLATHHAHFEAADRILSQALLFLKWISDDASDYYLEE